MRWPEGPPHLALNSLFFISFFWGGCFFLSFLFFVIQKKLGFPRKGAFFCLFLSLSLCFSLAFFGLPLFQLCLSTIIFFFSSFLSASLLSFTSFFLSLSFLLFLLCFCFMKGTTSKHLIAISCFINIFSFSLVSCLAFSFKSLFLIFVCFPDLKLCFCST